MSGRGVIRGEDGILQCQGGQHYNSQSEAIKTWWAGEQRIGCGESVFYNYSSGPCGKIPKHDPDANGNMTRCGVHSAAAKERRKAAARSRDQAWRAKNAQQTLIYNATRALESALRQIAEGHNDARGLAQEIIAALDAARRTE